MKIIMPVDVTAEKIISSNVAITETEWTPGTYNTGDQRYVGEDIYEVVADPSTSDEPTTGAQADPPSWLRLGKINRLKMFDGVLGSATVQSSETIDITVNPGELVTGIALFEIVANTVRVVLTDPVDGEIYDRTIDITSTTMVTDWYSYFFEPTELSKEAIFADMPIYVRATVRIVVTSRNGDAQVGQVFMGRLRTLGATVINTEIGIEDFSRKERDAFGRFVIVERRFARLGVFDVWLTNSEVRAAARALADRRALPTVYIGDETRPETIIAGFYRDWSILRNGPESSEMSIEIEGLV